MVRCEHCGTGLGPDAEFCPVCGSPVGQARPEVEEGVAVDVHEADSHAAGSNVSEEGVGEDRVSSDASEPSVPSPSEGEEAIPDKTVPDETAMDEWSFDEPEPWEFEADDWPEPEPPHPVRRAVTIVGVAIGILVMVLLTLPMVSSPSGRAPVIFSTPAALYPNEVASAGITQEEVLDRARVLGIDAWTDWTPAYDENGQLSALCAQQATNLLNLYRFAAGVDPVDFTAESDAKAQAVVDVYAGTEFQAHTITMRPEGMDDATFAMAQDAAQRSNVGVGYGNWGLDLPAYIAEVDPNPNQPNYETVGHRRHLLGTSLANVGFGLNGPYSAIFVGEFDGGRIDETVAWPACETPFGLWIQGTPWSVSLPYAIEDDEAVGVRIVRERDGRVWETADMAHFFVDHGSYHDASAVIFTPSDMIVEVGDRYHVEVDGLANGTLAYDVEFFDIGFYLG